MLSSLTEARKIATSVRYRGDKPVQIVFDNISSLVGLRDNLYKDGLEVSTKVTPAIGEKLAEVCARLKIPANAISAFVYASPEIQAECFSGSQSMCVIRFSSALVELLDSDEFAFVAGHEIGHFLLDHGLNNLHRSIGGLDQFLQVRAQEISADRIGLLACGSIDTAVRALMKTVSGLGSRHLRFNVSEFLAQLGKVSDGNVTGRLDQSHPPIILRCKSLLWFSMSDLAKLYPAIPNDYDLAILDERIREDLNSDVDGIIRERIQECKTDYRLWQAAKAIVTTGSFSKERQRKVVDLFGQEVATKLKVYLSGLAVSGAAAAVEGKILEARGELSKLLPVSFAEEAKKIDEEVFALLKE